MRFYPFSNYMINDVVKRSCSEHGGILRSIIAAPARKYSKDIQLLSVSGQMPNYHKIILEGGAKVNYHLTGYGLYHEEATIRLIGEAIERYSLMVGHYPHRDRIKYATYSEIRKEGNVIPWEYLQVFGDEDYERFQNSSYKKLQRLTESDVVGWIQCASLVNPGEEIWMPLQMLFVGYGIEKRQNEVPFITGFSTGTASHVSMEKALINAICEFVQIDALMVNWYTGRASDEVLVDDLTLINAMGILGNKDNSFKVRVYDLTLMNKFGMYVFGCAIENKKEERPFIVFGAQGEMNPLKGVYRALMEATAISFLGYFGPLYSPNEYFANQDLSIYDDLDKNVSFYIHPSNAEKKRILFANMSSGKKKLLSSFENYDSGNEKENLQRLLESVRKISRYAVYLDITPPEVAAQGWHVMRVFIPELVTMCMPGIPYSRHPRFAEFGGIKNEYPHPLP